MLDPQSTSIQDSNRSVTDKFGIVGFDILTMLSAVLATERKGSTGTTADIEDVSIANAGASIGLTQGEVI